MTSIADSKWLAWEQALNEHDITVDFLCPADVERFRKNKAKS